MRQPEKQLKVHSALLTASLIYGVNYSIAKIAMLHYIEPLGLILIRVIGATLLFWFVATLWGGERIRYRRDWIRLILCAITGVAINQMLFFKGLSMTTTISAAIIMTSNPIIVLVMSYLILKEKITQLKAVGLLMGSAGAVMLIMRSEISWEVGSFLGDLFIFLNAASYGFYLVLAKPLMSRYQPITIMKWIFLFGIFLVMPFGAKEAMQVEWTQMPVNGWLSIAFIIFFTTFLAYMLNIWALRHVNPTVVSYYVYLQPLFATVMAFFFLDEMMTLDVVIFALMIFTGVFLVSRR